jgi:hypothetical protein
MAHYRFYELDFDDHITSGYSAECPSDAAAMTAAGRLLEQAPTPVVEVWRDTRRVAHLSAATVAAPLNRRTT